MKVKIYYHHTDSGGVVYYANYLNFLEEARTEFLEKKGVSVKDLSKQGILFVVSRQEIDYKAPSHYGDILEIETQLASVSRVKLEFTYEIKNQEGRVISIARTILVCVGLDFKPRAIPEEVRQRLGF